VLGWPVQEPNLHVDYNNHVHILLPNALPT
jgi:hypothetical protein